MSKIIMPKNINAKNINAKRKGEQWIRGPCRVMVWAPADPQGKGMVRN